MDDVWERVDLIKVGIPVLNQDNVSKLIFTTRFLEVCGKMEAQEKIEVKCLRKDEAWELFEKKVGEETLDSHPDTRGLAQQVAAKCGGLPLALITIGRAMACKKMPQDWKYAIEVLQKFPHKLARMDQQVYSLLKFSYDSLPTDTMRSCLLYCSLYPEDYKIGVIWLIEYWFCEGFLDEFDNISRARMQGYSIINFLCNACLLERCEDAIFVKMHDVIRDMALWIARECEAPEKKFLVRERVKLNTTYDVENWKGVRMSLSYSEIEVLRGTPRCPNLQTLFLNENNLMMISDGLFQFMRNLRVLSLYANFSLCELPKGISNLVSLECLNLSHTGIMELPIELNRLSKLKVLNLHETLQLQKIPRQFICKFSALQVFGMSVLFDICEDLVDEDNVLNGDHEGLIEELKCLQHLNELNIEIRSVVALESLLSCHNLRRCTERLFLRDLSKRKVLDILSLTHMEHLESLIIRFCESMEEIVIRKIEKAPYFHTLKRVSLCSCNNLRDITWLILAPKLTHLYVVFCSRMEEIISDKVTDVVGIPNPSPFANLEELDLRDLPELKSIYRDALSFPCLRKIKVFNCSKLENLPLNLDSRNQISIEGYQEWWEKIQWKDEATRKCFLPSFKCAEWWKEVEFQSEYGRYLNCFFW
ncbi:Disease resistance protein family [Theobroma cacao]|uniref:Disease resistance protein family n=1 Tax=Theobroma cacao TaxID=3641 RepID=A0A061G7M9_THECC|nr:Disease resistance protein family [Theobroma cacao]